MTPEQTTEFRLLFQRFREARNMYGLVDARFGSVVAFVAGCDAATEWALLNEFPSWLDGRYGVKGSLWWARTVVKRCFPGRGDSRLFEMTDEESAVATEELFDRLDEYLRMQQSTLRQRSEAASPENQPTHPMAGDGEPAGVRHVDSIDWDLLQVAGQVARPHRLADVVDDDFIARLLALGDELVAALEQRRMVPRAAVAWSWFIFTEMLAGAGDAPATDDIWSRAVGALEADFVQDAAWQWQAKLQQAFGPYRVG
jgi:hypothetical protein